MILKDIIFNVINLILHVVVIVLGLYNEFVSVSTTKHFENDNKPRFSNKLH